MLAKLFDLDDGTINIKAVKMLVLNSLHGYRFENKASLEENIEEAVQQIFELPAARAISDKKSIDKQAVNIQSYFNLNDLRDMQNKLVDDIEDMARMERVSIYYQETGEADLDTALIQTMTDICDSVSASQVEKHQCPEGGEVDYQFNVDIDIEADNWNIQTYNGKFNSDCLAFLNGQEVSNDEDNLEAQLLPAMIAIACDHAHKSINELIVETLMEDEELVNKATLVSKIIGNDIESCMQLANSLNQGKLDIGEAMCQLQIIYGCTQKQSSDVVDVFL